jgi:DNA replication protein DnaC
MKTIDQLIAESEEQEIIDDLPIITESPTMAEYDGKEYIYRHVGFPQRHKDLEEVHGDEWLTAYNRAMSIIQDNGIVALIGSRGAGKTQMAWQIAKSVTLANITTQRKRDGFSMVADRPSIYSTAMDVFIDIKSTYSPKAKMTERELMDTYESAALLVIDEINVSTGTPFEDLKITHIMDMRYKAMRPSIIIGNLTMDQLNDRLGPSVVARIVETGTVIECKWPSFRTTAKP